jgi:hypothetical protein
MPVNLADLSPEARKRIAGMNPEPVAAERVVRRRTTRREVPASEGPPQTYLCRGCDATFIGYPPLATSGPCPHARVEVVLDGEGPRHEAPAP